MIDKTVLADIAANWGAFVRPPKLISQRENAVYDVTFPSGRAAVRLHRPGYHSKQEIISELHWMELLSERDFPVPRPLHMHNGDLIHTTKSGQFVTVISWMPGAPIGDGAVPFSAPVSELEAMHFDIGRLLARLHNVSDDLTLPVGFRRPAWDRDALVGPSPLWGKYWQAKILSPSEAELICKARDRARGILASFDAVADMGLIHADALRENVFMTDAGLSLIDFDDAGIGYRMYELGSCLTQAVDEPAYDAVVAAMLDGYADQRHLSQQSRELYPMFAMLRAFSALGWTIPRLSADHPYLPRYVQRATKLANEFLADRNLN